MREATIFAVLGVAFAAFCVWLGVRIINRRNKPGRKFWATLALVVPVLYVASFGPARAAITPKGQRVGTGPLIDAFYALYRPIFWATNNNHGMQEIVERYCDFCQWGY